MLSRVLLLLAFAFMAILAGPYTCRNNCAARCSSYKAGHIIWTVPPTPTFTYLSNNSDGTKWIGVMYTANPELWVAVNTTATIRKNASQFMINCICRDTGATYCMKSGGQVSTTTQGLVATFSGGSIGFYQMTDKEGNFIGNFDIFK